MGIVEVVVALCASLIGLDMTSRHHAATHILLPYACVLMSFSCVWSSGLRVCVCVGVIIFVNALSA